jgi:hypothetical protein
MKPLALIGLLLVVVGFVALGVGHFSYTTQKQVVDVGPLKASVAEQHDIAFPDVAGIGAIVVGGILVLLSFRRA